MKDEARIRARSKISKTFRHGWNTEKYNCPIEELHSCIALHIMCYMNQ